MSLTWTQSQIKAQTLAGDFTANTLVQLKQDMNIGQRKFNASLGRYFSRKQQFANLVAGQQLYQTPIDCVKVMGMTVMVSSNFQPTVKEIRSEYQWRQIVSWQTNSNWPAYYYMIGKDQLSLWPAPSQSVVNGLRFYYQPQSYDLSIEDITDVTTSATVTVTNASTTVTASSGICTANMIGLNFQLTGVNDLTWYEILEVPTATTLTLKQAFVGLSGSAQAFRIGQSFIFPEEYDDAPIDYALSRYFESKNNPQRAAYYYNENPNNLGRYNAAVKDAIEQYSSSNESNVISDDDMGLNPWTVVPVPYP